MKNIKTYTKLIAFSLVLMFTATSCDEDLVDINQNPNAAVNIDPGLLFPEVIVNFSSSRTVELNAININAQHWASGGSAGVFSNPERYILSTFTTGNTWSNWYSNNLKNLFLVKDLVANDSPEDLQIVGQAQVLEAFIYLNLTLIWEDIPFSEAINATEFPSPNFDTQEEVLNGILVILDEAIANLNASGSDIVTGGDLIFNGDAEKWIKWANSIKLKTLMLIANKNPGAVSAQIQALVNQPLILDNADEAKLDFSSEIGGENPIWRTLDRFAGGANLFWFSGSTLVNLMQGLNDPRIPTYFDANDDGEYVGQDQGVFTSAGISPVSLNIIRPEMPDRYTTASENNFLLAEAALLGYISGGAAAADTYFKAGVQASLDFYDGKPGAIDAADKTAYMGTLPDLTGLSEAEAYDAINDQHYISLFSRGLEAWTQWRRTKSVDLQQPVEAVISGLIRRYSYPPDELGSNPNTPSQKPLDAPMWFEN